jgi:hypothetical protein
VEGPRGETTLASVWLDDDLAYFASRVPLGTVVDARDVDDAWCLGVVVGEARDAGVLRRFLRVHYCGWDATTDDWISVADSRIAPAGLHTAAVGI